MTEHVESRTNGLSLDWLREHAWIAGWWALGRAAVFATAFAVQRHGNVLEAWDGRWYRLVASDGYLLVPGRQSDPAFFPLYPVLLRGAHALGFGYTTGGVVISNCAFLVVLAAMYVLTRDLLGDAMARRTVVYLSILPLGFVFSMDYPESVVLAAMALAAIAALRARWAAAALCAAVACLARPEAAFLSLPLLALAWRQRHITSPATRGLALGTIAMPAATLGAFGIYLDRVVHDPLAWSQAERAWGRRFSPLGFVRAFTGLPHALASDPWLTRDVVATIVYLALLAAALRGGVPRSWVAAGLLVVVLPLFSGDFDSIARFGLLAPATLWGLAWLGRTPRADRAIRAASLALLVAGVATIPYVFP